MIELFTQSIFLLSFVRGLRIRPHINWNWQFFLYFNSQQWKVQTYWTIGFSNLSRKLQGNLEPRQLSSMQAL